MSKEEFLIEVKILFQNYNRQISKEILEIWYDSLKDFDNRYLKKAIKKIITTTKFMPSLSEILDAIKNLTIEDSTFTEEEKLKQFKKENTIPNWYGKEIKGETDKKSQKELEEILKEFK